MESEVYLGYFIILVSPIFGMNSSKITKLEFLIVFMIIIKLSQVKQYYLLYSYQQLIIVSKGIFIQNDRTLTTHIRDR